MNGDFCQTSGIWKGEGVGIEPDVICSDEELEQKLKKITKDKKLRFENDK